MPGWRTNKGPGSGGCNVDLQIPPFRPQSPTAFVVVPFRNPLHRHPSSAVHSPPPLWMLTRHSFPVFPASSRLQSTRFASDDVPPLARPQDPGPTPTTRLRP
ncbi:hypothetical protein B0T18DRAFT_408947 [Schizothecium vesticola]|uniref:Uncharacterized protein n=1 Tax=Schizothecium vesticola TaxID=314040 RepID=A0AA40K925_9PEZI|nr:hypothetical protein B0T18DRAFT_408947 [Schizothecium vesticola]